MDFGNAPKAAPVGGPPAITRAEVVATQGSVRVELPPEQTVQSAQAGSPVKLDVRAQTPDLASRDLASRDLASRDLASRNLETRDLATRDAQARDVQSRAAVERATSESLQQRRQGEAALDEALDRRLVIEPRTQTVVLQEKDPSTGETISQLPDETLLKLRIYSRELTERAQDVQDARRREVERIA